MRQSYFVICIPQCFQGFEWAISPDTFFYKHYSKCTSCWNLFISIFIICSFVSPLLDEGFPMLLVMGVVWPWLNQILLWHKCIWSTADVFRQADVTNWAPTFSRLIYIVGLIVTFKFQCIGYMKITSVYRLKHLCCTLDKLFCAG